MNIRLFVAIPDRGDDGLRPSLRHSALGTDGVSKTDETSEKFQTAFDPPPLIFGKSYCGFRDKIATKVRMFIMAGLLCII